jgi:hypothetical protein
MDGWEGSQIGREGGNKGGREAREERRKGGEVEPEAKVQL